MKKYLIFAAFILTALPLFALEQRYSMKNLNGPLSITGNVGISSATPSGLFVVGAGNTPTFMVTTGGNVGISCVPDFKFKVIGSPGSSIFCVTDNTNASYQVEVGAAGCFVKTDNGTDIAMGDGTVKTIFIQGSSNNVGIGTTAPTATLDVNGGIAPKADTMANLKALAPPKAGVQYYDSTNKAIIVSTGTAAGAFGLIHDGNTKPTGW